jgi:hypothetical protein
MLLFEFGIAADRTGRTHLKMIQIQEHYRGMDKGK